MMDYPTNAAAREGLGDGALAASTWERLEALGKAPDLWKAHHQGRGYTPEQLIAAGLVDPLRMFGKRNEPHNPIKVAQRRYRQISSVSLLDSLVERMLCRMQNQAEIEDWERCPSKPGMGLHDEGLTKIARAIQGIANRAEADISGFDYTVQGWELEWDARMRAQLMGASPWMERVLLNRAYCLAMGQICLSDGRSFNQLSPCFQKSGSYNTSSTNSRIRIAIAWLVGASQAIAMGDDCVETFVEGAADSYTRLGHPVKGYKAAPEEVEFCSTLFTAERAAPVRWDKLTYRLLNNVPSCAEDAEELLSAFVRDMRHSEELPRALDLVRAVGWPLRKAAEAA